jgi:hypothetical protein
LNFKKLLIIVVAVVALIGAFKYFTRVTGTDPVAVGTAFTKALRARDTTGAKHYVLPERADAWQVAADANLKSMRSGTLERFFEGIPSSPAFAAATGATASNMKLESSDKSFTLEMTQTSGKWYVSKGPI